MFALYNRFSDEIQIESKFSTMLQVVNFFLEKSYLSNDGVSYEKITVNDIDLITWEIFAPRLQKVLKHQNVFLADNYLFVEKLEHIHALIAIPSAGVDFVPDERFTYLISSITYFDTGVGCGRFLFLEGAILKNEHDVSVRRNRHEIIEEALENLI